MRLGGRWTVNCGVARTESGLRDFSFTPRLMDWNRGVFLTWLGYWISISRW
jgi:hypothetical protein